MNDFKQNNAPISENIINLVVARLEAMPRNIQISVGGLEHGGTYNIDALISSVKEQNDIGRKMVDVQLSYLRNLNRIPTQAGNNVVAAI